MGPRSRYTAAASRQHRGPRSKFRRCDNVRKFRRSWGDLHLALLISRYHTSVSAGDASRTKQETKLPDQGANVQEPPQFVEEQLHPRRRSAFEVLQFMAKSSRTVMALFSVLVYG